MDSQIPTKLVIGFFVEAVNKSVHDAMLNHNITFLNTFHNTMKEVFHGFSLNQVRLAYYNIPHPSTQGTNQAGTSHQKAARNDDVQVHYNTTYFCRHFLL